MSIQNKILILIFSLPLLLLFYSCENSTSEPETLFEYNDRFNNSISLPSNVSTIIIANAIGFINVTGSSDSTSINYVLDKTVKAKDISLSEEEFQKINLDYFQSSDSLFISITSPNTDNGFYKSSLNLNVPYSKNVVIKTPNEGTNISFLNSDLLINTESFPATVFNHNGSLEINSVQGNINTTIAIPVNGNCKINSESGNITIRIPISTSANVKLKTEEGTIKYSNLDIALTLNTSKEINGKLNNGSALIDLYSKKGNIILEGF